jgi:hypothetical protein
MTEEEEGGEADEDAVGEACKRRLNILTELKEAWKHRKHQIWDGPEERYWLRVRDPQDDVDNFGTIKTPEGMVNTSIRNISP